MHPMSTSFWRLGWRTLWRDLRAGELRLLIVAVLLAVAALTAVGFFADRLKGGLQPLQHTLGHPWGEVLGQLRLHFADRAGRALNQLLDDGFGVVGIAHLLGGAVEMPALDGGHGVVLVLAEKRHGHLHIAWRPLVGALAEDGVGRHHVIHLRQLEAAAGQQMDAEVLRMSIRCAQQPEQDL